MLCDGLILEIFDREVSITEPVLHVDKANLRKDFNRIRAPVEPMQVWFFQKRRVVRLIDKVFDREFNLQRVAEFKRSSTGGLTENVALFSKISRATLSRTTKNAKST